MAALDHAFTPAFRAVAEQFGIDVRKPAELCHHYREQSGLHVTQGWFHAVGSRRAGADAWKPAGENAWVLDLEDVGCGIDIGFSSRISLLPNCFDGSEVVQLEFVSRVPWVISDPEPE